MRLGSLFSGCGGLDLGLERAGFEVAWMAEKDPPARRVLERHWPDVPVLADVRHADDWLEPVDLLAGGFPCQDLSYAGKAAGLDGDRSGLWHAFADSIRLLRPRLVLVENVPGLASRGLGRVLYDLAESGYVGRWFRLRASDLGAAHGRERIFVLATADSGGKRRLRSRDAGGARGPAHLENGRPSTRRPAFPATAGGRHFGKFEPAIRRWEGIVGRPAPRPTDDLERLDPGFVEWMLGFPADWTLGEKRRSRLRMLGNAVQVECAELVGGMLLELDALGLPGPGFEVAAATSRLDDSRRAGFSKERPVVVPGGAVESRPLSIDTKEGL